MNAPLDPREVSVLQLRHMLDNLLSGASTQEASVRILNHLAAIAAEILDKLKVIEGVKAGAAPVSATDVTALRELVDAIKDLRVQVNVPQASAPSVSVAPVLEHKPGRQWRFEPEMQKGTKMKTGAYIVTAL